jgi:hypothetical protein
MFFPYKALTADVIMESWYFLEFVTTLLITITLRKFAPHFKPPDLIIRDFVSHYAMLCHLGD